jgi:hypothetical protein
MRATLIVLCALYLSAVLAKGVFGDWLTAPDLVANLLLGKNVEAVRQGLSPATISPVVVGHPAASNAFRYGVLLFEASFGLVLLGGPIRAAYLAAVLVFHALNALLLIVTFTPILIVYGLFVDWQGLALRWPLVPPLARTLERIPPSASAAGAVALAALAGWAWNAEPALRAAVQLGGHLDWRTIWYPVLPLALLRLLLRRARAMPARRSRPGR